MVQNVKKLKLKFYNGKKSWAAKNPLPYIVRVVELVLWCFYLEKFKVREVGNFTPLVNQGFFKFLIEWCLLMKNLLTI